MENAGQGAGCGAKAEQFQMVGDDCFLKAITNNSEIGATQT